MEGPSICIQHWNHLVDETRKKSPGLPEWAIPWAWIGESRLAECYPLKDKGDSHSSPGCLRKCVGLYNLHIGDVSNSLSQPSQPNHEFPGEETNDINEIITLPKSIHFNHDLVDMGEHSGELISQANSQDPTE
eukprot:15835777-Heterocapsa_arctica.AAC.1